MGRKSQLEKFRRKKQSHEKKYREHSYKHQKSKRMLKQKREQGSYLWGHIQPKQDRQADENKIGQPYKAQPDVSPMDEVSKERMCETRSFLDDLRGIEQWALRGRVVRDWFALIRHIEGRYHFLQHC